MKTYTTPNMFEIGAASLLILGEKQQHTNDSTSEPKDPLSVIDIDTE